MKVQVIPYEQDAFDKLCLLYEGGKTVTAGINRFFTHYGKDTLTHVCEYPARREIRTVVCPLPEYATLPENTTQYSRRNQAALYQIDVDNRRINCGMSYLLHLPDGRFFMIDGGYFSKGECDRLHAFLRTLQPEGKLQIAGWFFSHAHQDHMGCFIDFAWKYGKEAEIGMLYYTFPSLSLPEAKYFSKPDNSTIREFYYTLDRALPSVKRCHLHTGNRFHIAGFDFEVLFTHEDIYPETIGTFNDTSTVLRVTYEGQSLLFLGDLQENSCRKLEKMQGDYLKSDILQVAHHGFNGSTPETYTLVSPTVALWPTLKEGYYGNSNRSANACLISMECVKEQIISGIHGSRKLPLPYTVGGSEAVLLPLKPLV